MYKIVCHPQKLFHVALLLLPVAANAGEYHRVDGANVPRESHNPDADEQTHLRVVWRATTEKNGRLIIPGTLFLESNDRKSKEPIDWVQPVRVLISRRPTVHPDWSKEHYDSDSTWDDCIILKNGSFAAEFRVDQVNRTVGRTKAFQVGLCLGEKYGTTIVWETVPVLPQTVATVRIAGPRSLNQTLKLINAVPSINLETYDPVPLIRAVNHLQSLGKTKAIAALRDFLEIANCSEFSSYDERDPANIDTCDRWCVYLIVQLLFEPKNPGEKRPVMDYADYSMYPSKEDELLWPHCPLAVHDDIPFLVAQMLGIRLGVRRDPIVFVEWAEKHGTLRKSKLRPPDNPLATVDAFLSLPKTKRLLGRPSTFAVGGLVRRQAWRMIENVVGPPRSDNAFFSKRGYDAESGWQKHKVIAKPNQLLWDAIHQRYTQQAVLDQRN